MLLKSLFVFYIVLNSSFIFADKNQTKTPDVERYKALETFSRALHYIETEYVDPKKVKLTDLIDYAIEGITSKLDPHTSKLTKRDFEQMTSDTKGQIPGIGVRILYEKKKLIIKEVIKEKPAMKKGILEDDEIIAINDVPLSKIGRKYMEHMEGKPGSKLKLTIRRKNPKGVFKTVNFHLIREIIKISSVESEKLSEGLYFVRIAAFQENTSQDLESFLSSKKKDISGLILDLRNNPGGLLDEATRVVDLFVESGLIVSTVGRPGAKIEREFAHLGKTFSNFPLIVLINEGSASASEIVAGALQDHGRALIMGNPSFGKGSVQKLFPLPDQSGLKLTVSTYYTPKDRSIQAKGIKPDIVISKNREEPSTTSKKEVHLRGHLLGNDLSDLAKKSSMLDGTLSWPKYLSQDYQVVTAFSYLKGWNLLRPKTKSKDERVQSKSRGT